MRAAGRFVSELAGSGVLAATAGVRVDLYGSLAATGAGHGTFSAILLGLEGFRPEDSEPDALQARLRALRIEGRTRLAGSVPVPLTEDDIVRHPGIVLDAHPNALTLTAIARDGDELLVRTYFSVGGGFIVGANGDERVRHIRADHPMSFGSASELLRLTIVHGMPISGVMLAGELASAAESEIRAKLLHLRDVMIACCERGCSLDGYLPGPLRVRRRARQWFERLSAEDPHRAPEYAEDWVNLVALAVNEENAAGGRVVTAPTNGAAGIIPAVLHFATRYTTAGQQDPDGTAVRFLLTAGAIGSLCKERASISGAEVGCQGEVGSAAAMAAAGLAEILGGTPEQVENAAEIAMEHSLGLTCDPIGGLVQIPCIERNAISAGKAINAARMAMRGNGIHRVSLDQVIETMRATGRDMSVKYKETATGGLAVAVAVNTVEC